MIGVIVASFNRREQTLQNLRALERVLELSGETWRLFLLDDASPDGTGAAVRQEFPTSRVVDGSGDLFWSRGMRAALRSAASDPRIDTYLLFNDDVDVSGTTESAVAAVQRYRELTRDGRTVTLVGATISRGGEWSYAGYRLRGGFGAIPVTRVFPVESEELEIDTFNANFVLAPRAKVDAVNAFDARYKHDLADIDLGLSLKRAEVEVLLFGLAVGLCEAGPGLFERARSRDRRSRFRMLFLHPNDVSPQMYFVWKFRPRLLFPLYLARGLSWRALAVLRP